MKKVLAMVLALAAVLTIAVASVGAATLSDGTYTVPVKLWKASSDGASMAQVIGDNATVEVKDGAITMTVTTKQMEMMGITGDLTGLRVSDGKGGYVDATVTSTDANGLPTAFTFPVAASDYEFRRRPRPPFRSTLWMTGWTPASRSTPLPPKRQLRLPPSMF